MHPNSGPHPPYWYGMPPNMRVGDADRERTIDHLKYAFGEGRLNNEEFEERVAAALAGRTRSDLEALLDDLLLPMPAPPMSMPSLPMTPHPPVQPPSWINNGLKAPFRPMQPGRPRSERGWAATAHWAAFVAPVVGPLVIGKTVGSRSEFVRTNAREALNFHLTCLISLLLLIPAILFVGFVDELLLAAASVGALLGGARALGGDSMRYAVNLRLVKK
jgi:uncharacterized protein